MRGKVGNGIKLYYWESEAKIACETFKGDFRKRHEWAVDVQHGRKEATQLVIFMYDNMQG